MRGRSIVFVGAMLIAVAAGVWASMTWGTAVKPWVGAMMILVGLMFFTSLLYRTEDGGRIPARPSMKWLGGAFICQGAAQLVPEGPVFWVLMTAAMILLAGAFVHMRKSRAAA